MDASALYGGFAPHVGRSDDLVYFPKADMKVGIPFGDHGPQVSVQIARGAAATSMPPQGCSLSLLHHRDGLEEGELTGG